MESADGIQFLIHRKNLEAHTKELALLKSGGNSTRLTESSEILEILFQFTYPRKQPVLSTLPFDTLLSVADAVQKYQVYSAINSCEYELRKYVQQHPLDILVHALRYYGGYEGQTLLDECASNLSRKKQTYLIVSRFAGEGLDVAYIVKWMEYATKWDGLFNEVREKINKIPLHEDCWTDKHLCSNCRDCLMTWVHDLQDMESISALQEALANPQFLKQHHKQSHDRCRYCRFNNCRHRTPLLKPFEDEIAKIPKFSQLCDQRREAEDGSATEAEDGNATEASDE